MLKNIKAAIMIVVVAGSTIITPAANADPDDTLSIVCSESGNVRTCEVCFNDVCWTEYDTIQQ